MKHIPCPQGSVRHVSACCRVQWRALGATFTLVGQDGFDPRCVGAFSAKYLEAPVFLRPPPTVGWRTAERMWRERPQTARKWTIVGTFPCFWGPTRTPKAGKACRKSTFMARREPQGRERLEEQELDSRECTEQASRCHVGR